MGRRRKHVSVNRATRNAAATPRVRTTLRLGWLVTAFSVGTGAIGVYMVSPSITPTLSESITPKRARVNLQIGGGIPITDTSIECRPNKIVFRNGDTFIASGYATVDEPLLARMDPTEQVKVECRAAWSLFTNADEDVFTFGDMNRDHPPLALTVRRHGPPQEDVPSHPTGRWIDVREYQNQAVEVIDAVLEMRYAWPWWLGRVRRTRTIHLIAQSRDNNLVWRIAPLSEPAPADGGGIVARALGVAVRMTTTGRFLY